MFLVRKRFLIVSLGLLVLSAGCASGAPSAVPPGQTAQVQGTAASLPAQTQAQKTEAGSSPTPERTGPESPQAKSGGGAVSVSLPSLPVGQDSLNASDETEVRQCLGLRELGQDLALPAGYAVILTPQVSGPFTHDDSSCQVAGSRLCAQTRITGSGMGTACYVGATWGGQPPSEGSVSLDATLLCPNGTDQTCGGVQNELTSMWSAITDHSVGLDIPSPPGASPSATGSCDPSGCPPGS